MKAKINILPINMPEASTSANSGCSSGKVSAQSQQIAMAAGIDTDIFEADELGLEAERFWEAFWRTQHVYGGIAAGQSLSHILKALDAPIFEKLYQELQQYCNSPEQLDHTAQNDILGMLVFLLCIEKGDSEYDPIAQEGYEAALTYFCRQVDAEKQRRVASR